MARGSIAKANVTKKIAEIFGQDYVGEFDKKLIIWADDGGERVQIALSMTCPKTTVGGAAPAPIINGGFDFSFEPTENSNSSAIGFSEKEVDLINDLMRKLDL